MTCFPAVTLLAPSGDATGATTPVVVLGLVAAPGAPPGFSRATCAVLFLLALAGSLLLVVPSCWPDRAAPEASPG
jgi:hypothetical protein